MNKPTVSICIPAYNHERFVLAAIESVLSQDFSDFEIIVVDDASTDETFERVKEIEDTRVIKLRNERNLGSTLTFHRAVAASQGEFVCILASDDLFLPGKLRLQVDLMRRDPSLGAVFSQMTYIDESGAVLERGDLDDLFSKKNRSRAEWLRHLFIYGNCLATPTVMLRRRVLDSIGDHNPLLSQAPDFEYWIRLLMRYDINVMDEKLAVWRIHSDRSNTSAVTPHHQTRAYWEWTKLLNAYLAIEDESFVRDMFPESTINLGGLPASILLVEPAFASPHLSVQLFGAEVLRSLLSCSELTERLTAVGFGRAFLFSKLGEFDTFGFKRSAVWQEKYESLVASYELSIRDVREAGETIIVLRNDNCSASVKISKLLDELGIASEVIETLRHDVDYAARTIAVLRSDNAVASRTVEELRSDLIVGNDVIETLRHDVGYAARTITALRVDNEFASRRIAELLLDLDIANQTIATLRNDIDFAAETIIVLRSDNASASRAIEELRSDLSVGKEVIETLRHDVGYAAQIIIVLRSDVQVASEVIQSLKAERAALLADCAELRRGLDQSNVAERGRIETLNAVRRDRDELFEAKQLLEAQYRDTLARIDVVEGDLERSRIDHADFVSQMYFTRFKRGLGRVLRFLPGRGPANGA